MNKPSGPNRWGRSLYLTHLESTLMEVFVGVDSKPLTRNLTLLDATFTKNMGVELVDSPKVFLEIGSSIDIRGKEDIPELRSGGQELDGNQ